MKRGLAYVLYSESTGKYFSYDIFDGATNIADARFYRTETIARDALSNIFRYEHRANALNDYEVIPVEVQHL